VRGQIELRTQRENKQIKKLRKNKVALLATHKGLATQVHVPGGVPVSLTG
jgi:hypothetical protein